MGNCSSCKKDCSSRPTTPTPTHQGSGVPVKREVLTDYLKTPPKKKGDTTPLNYPCSCPSSPRAPRYQCIHCLRSWASASTFEEITTEIQSLKDDKLMVAAERLEGILKELRRQRIEK